MSDPNGRDRWDGNRTTFQRVYDVVAGTDTFGTAQEFAERADCSETAARNALEQLAEMGIAERRDGRPTNYRRNKSYFEWKRVESIAREHTAEQLQNRIDDLIAKDQRFQNEYGVPEPEAVSSEDLPIDDHDALHEQWEGVSEWRSVRRDIRVLRRAADRVDARIDDGVRA